MSEIAQFFAKYWGEFCEFIKISTMSGTGRLLIKSGGFVQGASYVGIMGGLIISMMFKYHKIFRWGFLAWLVGITLAVLGISML